MRWEQGILGSLVSGPGPKSRVYRVALTPQDLELPVFLMLFAPTWFHILTPRPRASRMVTMPSPWRSRFPTP